MPTPCRCIGSCGSLTARPDAADEARAPHALYGVRAGGGAGERGLVARRGAGGDGARAGCGAAADPVRGHRAVSAGADARGWRRSRSRARRRGRRRGRCWTQEGAAGLHARLAAVDPATAAMLRPSDGQRVARAWEVWRGTGRGLSAWQRGRRRRRRGGSACCCSIRRATALRAAIAARFEAMLAAGAVEEVRALLALGLDPGLPIMRAQGVPELAAYLRGEVDAGGGARRGRWWRRGQYVKRQATWFRNRSIADPSRHAYDQCAICGFGAIFGKRMGGNHTLSLAGAG